MCVDVCLFIYLLFISIWIRILTHLFCFLKIYALSTIRVYKYMNISQRCLHIQSIN